MTAVEYIKKRIEEDSDTSFLNIDWDKFDEIIKQALEMEKEQIKDAHFDGQCDETEGYPLEIAEQYYNETFKSE
jgi:hypothetical protein